MTRRRGRALALFPVNVWPPLVDAVTLVLAAFVLLMLVAFVAQRSLLARVEARDGEIERLRAEKTRIESRLRSLAPRGSIAVDDGKVILQGEVLFASGSADLRPAGVTMMREMGQALAGLLASERGQMVMIGGHTDDKALVQDARFRTNWELSSARALAVANVLIASGVPADRVLTAGFGEHHPRTPNVDDASRKQNRRIEVLLVPLEAVSSR